jgi:hypothetical protein
MAADDTSDDSASSGSSGEGEPAVAFVRRAGGRDRRSAALRKSEAPLDESDEKEQTCYASFHVSLQSLLAGSASDVTMSHAEWGSRRPARPCNHS